MTANQGCKCLRLPLPGIPAYPIEFRIMHSTVLSEFSPIAGGRQWSR